MAVGAKSVVVEPSLTSVASASALVSRTVSSRLLAPSTVGSSPSVQSGNIVATFLTSARTHLLSLSMKHNEVLHEDPKDVKVVVEELGLDINSNAR